ncbi:MAG: chaperone modulator CbpM [Legionellaceae bacterium]|nr:chaperone modulator CbpM [Legionellaceae bacterium]
MSKTTITVGVLVDEQHSVTFIDVCERQGIAEEALLELLEHGLLSEVKRPSKQLMFDLTMLNRIHSACRLHADLGINSPGIVLALELMDKLERLQSELRVLKRHVNLD